MISAVFVSSTIKTKFDLVYMVKDLYGIFLSQYIYLLHAKV